MTDPVLGLELAPPSIQAARLAARSEQRAPLARAEPTPGELQGLLKLLYRQARSLAGPRHDLDDIVQAAAERTLKALSGFECRSKLSTFTYGIVWRTLLDHDRWLARWRRRFVLNTHEPVEAACCTDSEDTLSSTRRARRLESALAVLPAAKRAALVLHDIEGYSASEVARVLQTKEGTVRSRLRDARLKVAEMLRDDPLFAKEACRDPR